MKLKSYCEHEIHGTQPGFSEHETCRYTAQILWTWNTWVNSPGSLNMRLAGTHPKSPIMSLQGPSSALRPTGSLWGLPTARKAINGKWGQAGIKNNEFLLIQNIFINNLIYVGLGSEIFSLSLTFYIVKNSACEDMLIFFFINFITILFYNSF